MQTSYRLRPGLVDCIRALCALALPVMLEQLGQFLLGTVDTYFAGQIGDNAIAAINVSNMFTSLFTGIFTSLGIGITVLIAHAIGEGDHDRGSRLLHQSILLGTGAGALIGLVCLLFRRVFLIMAGARGEILELAVIYFTVVCVPCIFLCLTMVFSGALKALQNTRSSMKAALCANIANAALDLLFIRMGLGVFGLGLATTLARGLNLLLLLRSCRREMTSIRLFPPVWRVELPLMKELAVYSLPIMLTQLSNRFISLVGGSLVLRLGDIYYVSHSVTLQLDNYVCIPMIGFEAAAASLVSLSAGAKEPKQVIRYTWLACLLAMAAMTVLGIGAAVWAVPLSSIFSDTLQVQLLVKQTLTFMAFFQWTSALAQVAISAVQGIGDSRTPFYATLVCNIVFRLGGGYLMAYVLGWNLVGIWASYVVDFMARCLPLGLRFARYVRENRLAS